MDFTFLKNGNVAFYRSDAEQAEWTQEEFNLHCVFPYDSKKEIERGMVILFQDINEWHAYEVRQCTVMVTESYQQITAESIAISELTDCHIPEKEELTNVTASSALAKALTGTGWNVGRVESNPVSSGNFSRGSAWDNVNIIPKNWNVYISPRVTVGQNGITGRYIDILSTAGVDAGLRMTVDKNITDPSVRYDDSELYTALYGYGGTYSEGSGDSRVTLEYNFSEVEWNKTSDHPAKPAGQKYLEYPEMTALYGRNGKPRFGYYQNTNVKDPETLLRLTWESLKQCCEPKISIQGTVTDLERLGLPDVPVRLHYMVVIDLEPIGVMLYRQIIKCTVDLLDPTNTRPEIGDYIPNIIYINRETDRSATGGGRGRGGGSRRDLEMSMYQTEIYDTGREVGMYARKVDEHGNILTQSGMHIDPETGVLVYAEDNPNMLGSRFRVTSEMIASEVRARTEQGNELSSMIRQTSNEIALEVSERRSADNNLSARIKVNADNILLRVEKNGVISSINQTSETVKISASRIELDGTTIADKLKTTDLAVASMHTMGGSNLFEGRCSFPDKVTMQDFSYENRNVSWKSKTITTYNLSNLHHWLWDNNGSTGWTSGSIVVGHTDSTIYYLGR